MQPVVVIPSRLASTRLPNKAISDICGVSVAARPHGIWGEDMIRLRHDDESERIGDRDHRSG
jgi:hypothetical protein